MPRECGMCKAVGFHPHLPLFSMISFYSEHSKISIYPELLNFYKLNGKKWAQSTKQSFENN